MSETITPDDEPMKCRDSIEAELVQHVDALRRIGPEYSGFGSGTIERHTGRAAFTLAPPSTPSALLRRGAA